MWRILENFILPFLLFFIQMKLIESNIEEISPSKMVPIKSYSTSHRVHKPYSDKPVNILIILADDLGYGDTSVEPFVGAGIHTPELKKMASKGTIMTNFHSAAAVCTPTRASILTGMFPWRLGIKAVYEYGEKGEGKSNRNDWLALVPTLAMIFRENNYTTGHSGKWHVGGMRNDDLDMRLLPDKDDSSISGSKRCPHPGPNQQGFDEYVSVLDGPGAPRQNELQVPPVLYSRGCEFLLQNDTLIGKKGQPLNSKEYLFDCEARHAIRMMTQSVSENKPFFLNVWFHAPHGPWEMIQEYHSLYGQQDTRFNRYRTMVTGMDRSIGNILEAVRTLGIEKNTLVVFLSDNGPEDDAGTTSRPLKTYAGYRGNKRYLYEGGIRVPSIWQWTGVIQRGRESKVMAISTDIFASVLDAASISLPKNAFIDSISLLPELVRRHNPIAKTKRIYIERLGLWHAEYERPRSTAAILFDFKIKLNENDHPMEIFDLKYDPFEQINLLPEIEKTPLSEILTWKSYRNDFSPQTLLRSSILSKHLQLDALLQRNKTTLHKFLVAQTYSLMNDFAKFGNEAHRLYLKYNYGRNYIPTIESDNRYVNSNIYRQVSKQAANTIRVNTIQNGYCSTPCSCQTPQLANLSSLPFKEIEKSHLYFRPQGFINATELLFGRHYNFISTNS